MRKKNIIQIVLGTTLLLLVPLGAMQFSDEVTWSPFDFAVAGVLLLCTGLAYELLASRARHLAYKLAVAVAVGAALLLVWINLAVGIIGSENNPANAIHFAVLAVGVISALLARFEPVGMARAMSATALAHALVAIITVVAGFASGAALTKTLFVDSFFIALWVGSALLFRWAGSEPARA